MTIHLMYQLLIVIAMLIIGNLLNVDIAVVITVVSSISVLSIIVIFIICGHHLSKRPTISQSSVCENGLTEDTSPTGPVYENLTSLTNDFKARKRCDNEKSNIDLSTNISYAPLPIVTK